MIAVMHQTKAAQGQKGREPTIGEKYIEAWACLNDAKNLAVMGIEEKTRSDWCMRISISVNKLNEAAAVIKEKGSSAGKAQLKGAKEAVCKKLDEIVKKTGEKKIGKYEIEHAVPEMLYAIESEVEKIAVIAQAKAGGMGVVEPPIKEALPAIAPAAPVEEASDAVTMESLLLKFIAFVGARDWSSSGLNEKFGKVLPRLNPESLKVVDSVVFDHLRGGVPHVTLQKIYVICDVIDDLFVETGVVDKKTFVKALDAIWEKERDKKKERASSFWGNPPFGQCHVARMEITSALKRERAAKE